MKKMSSYAILMLAFACLPNTSPAEQTIKGPTIEERMRAFLFGNLDDLDLGLSCKNDYIGDSLLNTKGSLIHSFLQYYLFNYTSTANFLSEWPGFVGPGGMGRQMRQFGASANATHVSYSNLSENKSVLESRPGAIPVVANIHGSNGINPIRGGYRFPHFPPGAFAPLYDLGRFFALVNSGNASQAHPYLGGYTWAIGRTDEPFEQVCARANQKIRTQLSPGSMKVACQRAIGANREHETFAALTGIWNEPLELNLKVQGTEEEKEHTIRFCTANTQISCFIAGRPPGNQEAQAFLHDNGDDGTSFHSLFDGEPLPPAVNQNDPQFIRSQTFIGALGLGIAGNLLTVTAPGDWYAAPHPIRQPQIRTNPTTEVSLTFAPHGDCERDFYFLVADRLGIPEEDRLAHPDGYLPSIDLRVPLIPLPTPPSAEQNTPTQPSPADRANTTPFGHADESSPLSPEQNYPNASQEPLQEYSIVHESYPPSVSEPSSDILLHMGEPEENPTEKNQEWIDKTFY